MQERDRVLLLATYTPPDCVSVGTSRACYSFTTSFVRRGPSGILVNRFASAMEFHQNPEQEHEIDSS